MNNHRLTDAVVITLGFGVTLIAYPITALVDMTMGRCRDEFDAYLAAMYQRMGQGVEGHACTSWPSAMGCSTSTHAQAMTAARHDDHHDDLVDQLARRR